MELLKNTTAKADLKVFSDFPAWRYAYVMLKI